MGKIDEISELILRISKKVKQKILSEVEDITPDLSIKEINLIETIGSHKKTMGEIAQGLNLTPGTITPVVDKLVRLKYLKRDRDEENDRRKVYIKLDKKGAKIEKALLKQRLSISNAILKDLSENEQDIVLDLFKKIHVNLEK